jgi:hypothetical protein
MSYPTKFTEVIQTAASYAKHEQVRQNLRTLLLQHRFVAHAPTGDSHFVCSFYFVNSMDLQEVAHDEGKLSYTILLILTAGNVEDVQETKQYLMAASGDPLSVVIVGIGEADFTGMEFLDSFDAKTEKGRDITKFVRFNDYKSYNALTEAVLDEIPDQLVDYYYSKGLLPGNDEGFSQDMVEVQPADDDERTFTFLG